MILYLKDTKNSIKKLLDLINIFSKVVGYKINTQKTVASVCTNNEQPEKKIKEISLTIALSFTKIKIPWNKLNKRGDRSIH
jgi:hypothetical protein